MRLCLTLAARLCLMHGPAGCLMRGNAPYAGRPDAGRLMSDA
jgi:hypothetical protein